MSAFLISLGFKPTLADSALHSLQEGNHIFLLLEYVNDLIITESSFEKLNHSVYKIKLECKARTIENLVEFLWIVIETGDG